MDTTGLYGLVVSPGAVRIDYEVDERIERSIGEVPVVPPQGRSEIQLEPVSATVTMTGARSVVEEIDVDRIWLEVPVQELSGLQPGEERAVSVQIRGAPDILSVSSEVDTVTARLPEEPSEP